MTRLRSFVRGVVSSYGTLATNILYTFASIPLALRYLSKEEFALWALVTQCVGYLMLIDAGMSSALTRLLIDDKDDRASSKYGNIVATASAVFVVQGAIIVLAGILFSGTFARLAGIEGEFQRPFISLMIIQCSSVGFFYCFKIFGYVLMADHRLDIANHGVSLNLLSSLAVLWVLLRANWGVMSLPCGFIIGSMLSTGIYMTAAVRLRLLPPWSTWRISWSRFVDLFAYARDVFLVNIGQQLISASQTIIVSRFMGLEAAAVWAVCLRPFTMLFQICWKPFDMSFTMFSEMIVRGEMERLRTKYTGIVLFTFLLSSFGALGFAMCNQPLVAVWTNGKIGWLALNDALLGIWLLLLTIARCTSWLIQATKEIGALRYCYFIEGAVFLIAGSLAVSKGGTAAMITVSIACTSLFSATYGVFRASRYLRLDLSTLCGVFVVPTALYMGMVGLPGLILFGKTRDLPPAMRLTIHGGFVVIASLASLRFVTPEGLKTEIARVTPRPFLGVVGVLLGRIQP